MHWLVEDPHLQVWSLSLFLSFSWLHPNIKWSLKKCPAKFTVFDMNCSRNATSNWTSCSWSTAIREWYVSVDSSSSCFRRRTHSNSSQFGYYKDSFVLIFTFTYFSFFEISLVDICLICEFFGKEQARENHENVLCVLNASFVGICRPFKVRCEPFVVRWRTLLKFVWSQQRHIFM